MPENKRVPADIKRKIRKLEEVSHALRQGEQFNITRLNTLKSLCKEPEIASHFVFHLVQLTQDKMNALEQRYLSDEQWEKHRQGVAKAISQFKRYLAHPEPEAEDEAELRAVWRELRELQNTYQNQKWGHVRIIESSETLLVEEALECVLNPERSSYWSYHVARSYAERYNPSCGTGLLPESAPMVEDIVSFFAQWYGISLTHS